MALHTGEPISQIIRNRRELVRALGVADRYHFVTAGQTHSDNVKVIEAKETRGWERLDDAIEDCDALITAKVGVILMILTADCVPLLLYDPVKKVVAAVHAGWKGTKAQIAAKTIETMQDRFGCDTSEIIVGIAPSIGVCCYEVGEDVASHFFGYAQELEQIGAKYRLDLPGINRRQLLLAGIKEEHIEMSGICTACATDRYFSYRKEQGCSGRFMSLIGMCE
jgi:YfiH family protein